MSVHDENLGKARLDLETNLDEFRANMTEARSQADRTQTTFDALAEVAHIAADAFGDIRMRADQAAETSGVSDEMKRTLAGISADAERARADLENVKIRASQAAESVAAGEEIKRNVKDIGDEADRTKRKLTEVKMSQSLGSKQIGGTSVGLLGAAIGAGTLLAPSAGPAVLGVLGAIPGLATVGVGAIGTLALAFHGLGDAIGGDKKAFDKLTPAQQAFVESIRSLTGWFDRLKQEASGDLFPGLTSALHSALSPGTLGAITNAVAEFATTIGEAGKAWGRYFGSSEFGSIFGPMMASAAHNLGTLSGAALKLFDALGVVGRAAIPLTTWMTNGVGKAADLANGWIHAADASGRLASGFQEAETSLKLVGELAGALIRAIGDLGAALYPVSKVAVRDLTSGLNTLASFFSRNQTTIQQLVGGALNDFVYGVRLAWTAAGQLANGIRAISDGINSILGPIFTAKNAVAELAAAFVGVKIVGLVGGWKDALVKAGQQAVITSQMAQGASKEEAATYVASMSTMDVATVGLSATIKGALISTGIGAIAVAIGIAAEEIITHWSTVKGWLSDFANWLDKHWRAVVDVAFGVFGIVATEIIDNWGAIKAWFADFAGDFAELFTHPIAAVKNMFSDLGTAITGIFKTAFHSLVDLVSSIHISIKTKKILGVPIPDGISISVGGSSGSSSTTTSSDDRSETTSEHGAGQGKPGTGSTGPTVYTQDQVYNLLRGVGVPDDVAANLATISAHGEDPSGRIDALNNNPKTGDYSVGLFQENFFKNLGPARVAQYAPQFGLSGTMPVDKFVQWLGMHPSAQAQIAYQIYQSQGYSAWTTAAKLGITGGPGGANPGTDVWGTQPAWTKNTGASAAASLAASLKNDSAKLKTIEQQISQDAKQHLLPDDLVTELKKRAAALGAQIADGTKSSLPALSRSLSSLKSDVQDGLAQATDDRKLKQTIASIKDDLKNKLLPPDVARTLLAQANKLNDELTSGLLSPEARRKVEASIADLKKKLTLDLNLEAERKSLATDVASLNEAVSSGLFPPALESTAKKQATQVGRDIAEGTQAGSTAAKSALKQLAATIKEGVADATAIQSFQTAIANFKGQLQDKLDQALGIPATYATPEVLAAAEQGAEQIVKKIEQGLTGNALTAAKSALSEYQKTIESGLNGLEQSVELAKGTYEGAWSRLASAGDTAFSQQTQDTVQRMQDDLQNALDTMQVMVSGSGFASFLYGGDITETPSQVALEQLQQQHDDAQQQAQLAADQAAGDATAVAEDLYQIKVTALQRQADAEQKAAKKQLEDAKTAYKQQQDVAIKAYQQQRTLQQQALDDQVADIETAFEQGNIDAQTAFGQLTGLYQQNGVDIASMSLVIAGNIYDGVAAWTSPIMALMDDLLAKIQAVKDAQNGVGGGTGGGTNAPPPTSWAQSQGILDIEAAAGKILSKGAVPQLASGAIVYARPGGTLVNVGEGGRDEVVGPLSDIERHLDRGRGNGGDVVLVVDGREIARATANGLTKDVGASRTAAKAIAPHTPKIVTVGS